MRSVFAVLLVSALLATPCSSLPAEAVDGSQLGQPRADLTAAELTAFNEGKILFTQTLPGLGPLYNARSCADCHAIPTVGGSGDLDHAMYLSPRPPPAREGVLYHTHALPGWTTLPRPVNAGRRIARPLYGLGLVERIPDETIRARCGQGHPLSAKLPSAPPQNAVARFGVKPFLGSLTDFVGSELWGQCRISNPMEGPGSADDDAFPDPEVNAKVVETIAAFVRGLQPPGRNGTDPAGEAAFHSFGCAVCHVPDMPPATNVFSDFCAHRMGHALADGMLDREAKGDEFGTAPLQGLRFRKLYLHDGRATTLDAAIIAHGGEAQSAVTAYQNAPSDQRAALLRFLQTL
jgi:CxxC motif-containing protein (DUF1111 family)